MSDNRVVALASAVQLKLSPEATVAAAKVFEAYLAGATSAPAAKATGTKAVTGGGAASTAKKAPSKSEEEVVKAALEAQREEAENADGGEEGEEGEAVEDGLPATAEGVQAGIARLLKANKRKEAIALLKKFGAASASAVKAKDFAKFVAEVAKLVPAEDATDDGDLTA